MNDFAEWLFYACVIGGVVFVLSAMVSCEADRIHNEQQIKKECIERGYQWYAGDCIKLAD